MNNSNQYLYSDITLWRTFHSRQFFHRFPNKKTQTCSFSCWNFFIDGTCLHPSNNKNALWVFFKTKRRRLHGNLKKKREKRILSRILHLGKLSPLRLKKKITISQALMQVTVLNLLIYPTFCCFCITGRKPSSSIHSERWGLQTAHGHHAGGVQQRAWEGVQPHRQGQDVPHLRQGRPRRIR